MNEDHDRHARSAERPGGAHQPTRKDQLPIAETDRLIASDKVEGTAVYDRDGRSLGSIRNFMVDKATGKVAYAVLSFGGLLGLGERYHALPWSKLRDEPGVGGYVLDVPEDQLKRAPSYTAAEAPWSDPGYGRNVYEYYNVPWNF